MAEAYVTCPVCLRALPEAIHNRAERTPCPGCGTATRVVVFPALFRPRALGSAGERVMLEGEASCFYHPQKKAVVPCDRCGRFLCGLCDLAVGAEHLCPACLQTGGSKSKRPEFEKRRTIYASLAWALALYPLLPPLWFFTLLTAPVALVLAIWHWNTPGSLVKERTKPKLVATIVFATLEILVWVMIVLFASGVLQYGD